VCWNLALLPAEKRDEFLAEMRPAMNLDDAEFEDLKLKNMTRRAKAKQCPETGRWLKNGATAKAGLNRAILNVGLGRFEVLLRYKMAKAGKALFKVAPHHTSQECACCGHIHPGNRKNQADFRCTRCHFTANADFNAALVIRKRAITLIKHSGTELAGTQGNVLQPGTDAKARKTRGARAHRAGSCLLKKTVAAKRPEARLL
jgi:putative transposase